MDYKEIFKPETIEKLNAMSADSLQTLLGDMSPLEASSKVMTLSNLVSEVEREYRRDLERLVVEIVKETFPIAVQENIKFDAKIQKNIELPDDSEMPKVGPPPPRDRLKKRRIINAITQGASVRGGFSFFLFKEALDAMHPKLVERYNSILKYAFGVYDDPKSIAMFLAMIASNRKVAGGVNKVEREKKEDYEEITIVSRGINFPILLHETVKGLFEVLSLFGFKDDKESNQLVVSKVDKYRNEPEDLRYGKFIYDSIIQLYNRLGFEDPISRELFFTKIYELDGDDMHLFIENLLNDDLTRDQEKWAIQAIESTLQEIKSILKEHRKKKVLLEFTEATVNRVVNRFKEEQPDAFKSDLDVQSIKNEINRFDSIKGSIPGNQTVISNLSDSLKDKDLRDIGNYSYSDFKRVMSFFKEKEDKILKQAAKRFTSEFNVSKEDATSYTRRFLTNAIVLDQAIEGGLPDRGFSAQEVRDFIPKELLQPGRKYYLDPRLYPWQIRQGNEVNMGLYPIVDILFQEGGNVDDLEKNNQSHDGSVLEGGKLVYNKDGIQIYSSDAFDECVKIRHSSGRDYSHCIMGSLGLYRTYRYKHGSNRSMYFVFDRNRTDEIDVEKSKKLGRLKFKDPYHFVTIQVAEFPEDMKDNEKYLITTADNIGDKIATKWEDIPKLILKYDEEEFGDRLSFNSTWERIKDLEELFVPIKLTMVDKAAKMFADTKVNKEEFLELTLDEKMLYVQAKSEKSEIPKDILTLLPSFKYKIEGENRTTNLAFLAINSGHKFPYDILDKHEAVAKRYAIYTFRQKITGKDKVNPQDVIPFSYLKFLDEPARREYYNKFKIGYFDLQSIKTYLPEFLQEYIQESIDNFSYLPKEAINLYKGKDKEKLKTIVSVYSSSFSKISEDRIKQSSREETAQLRITGRLEPVSLEKLDRAKLTEISEVLKGITEKDFEKTYINSKGDEKLYLSTFLYACPIVIRKEDKFYFIVPVKDAEDSTFEDIKYIILDETGKKISKEFTFLSMTLKDLGEIDISWGSKKDLVNKLLEDKSPYIKMEDITSLQGSSESFDTFDEDDLENIQLNEYYEEQKIVHDYVKKQLQHRAGIIK